MRLRTAVENHLFILSVMQCTKPHFPNYCMSANNSLVHCVQPASSWPCNSLSWVLTFVMYGLLLLGEKLLHIPHNIPPMYMYVYVCICTYVYMGTILLGDTKIVPGRPVCIWVCYFRVSLPVYIGVILCRGMQNCSFLYEEYQSY